MAYQPRLERPVKGNKYYTTIAKGGYSRAIEGKCKTTGKPDTQCNVLANCVGYAYGRFNEIGNYGSCRYLSPVNAENFPEYAKGLTIGTEPKLGAIIVWKKGGTLKGTDGAGHVAVVERIYNDGSVLISQSGYNSNPFWTETIKKGDGNWRCAWMGTAYTFRCFIYNPAVPDTDNIITKLTLKKGMKNNDVKELQENLNILGYNLVVDSSFGNATDAAVRDFQKKNGLTNDGMVGPATDAAITKAVKKILTKPEGVKDIVFALDGKEVSAWGTMINGQNYIRLTDLQALGIVKSVAYNATKKIPEVITK